MTSPNAKGYMKSTRTHPGAPELPLATRMRVFRTGRGVAEDDSGRTVFSQLGGSIRLARAFR